MNDRKIDLTLRKVITSVVTARTKLHAAARQYIGVGEREVNEAKQLLLNAERQIRDVTDELILRNATR